MSSARIPTVCATCGRGPAPEYGGVTVYRENEPGEMPPIWRCARHREVPTDPETQRLVDALEGKAP